MDQKLAVQTPKKLYVDCYHDFSQSLASFKKQLQGLEEHQKFQCSIQLFYHEKDQNQEVIKLLFSRPRQNLTSFKTYDCNFEKDQLTIFLTYKWPNLTSIEMNQLQGGDLFYEGLPKCQIYQLEKLMLQECRISDSIVRHICTGKWDKLKLVNLSENNISSSGLELIGSAKWTNLENLDVCLNYLGQPVKNMGELFHFPKLKQMNFGPIQLNKMFAKLTNLNNHSLNIWIFLPVPFQANENVGWANMVSLEMGDEKISKEQMDIGMSNLCHYHFPNLRNLSIVQSYLSKTSVKQFTKAKWKQLTQLCLYQGHLEGESLKILAKCQWLQLVKLRLPNNLFGDCSLNDLTCGNWPKLKTTDLSNNSLTHFGTLVLGKSGIQKVIILQNLATKGPKIMRGIKHLSY